MSISNRELVFWSAVCFLWCFSIFLGGLAPSLTFEDSGEMLTASYIWGVAHPPGYPLNTILGHFFMSMLPVEPALAMNIMSAFFSSLAGSMLFLSFMSLAGRFQPHFSKAMAIVICMAAVIFMSVLPTYYRQSIITEVYGLNNFFCAVLIFLMIRALFRAEEGRDPWFMIAMLSFIGGLTLTNHHTSVLLLFAIFVIGVWRFRPWLSIGRWFAMLGFFAAGLTPYLYLPLASMTQPILDWGDPETSLNFWRVVTRYQYAPRLNMDFSQAIEQFRLQAQLFYRQFTVLGVLLGFLGLYILRLLDRWVFRFVSLALIMTGPVTAYLVNFHVSWENYFHMRDISGLVSVFYLILYMVWMIPVTFALLQFLSVLRAFRWRIVSDLALGSLLVLVALSVWRTFGEEGKAFYRPVDEMFANLQAITKEPAVVFTNWDPFSFPPMYLQIVEGKLSNFVFLDLELLKAPWYPDHLKRRYPAFYERIQYEIEEYKNANTLADEGKASPYRRPTIGDLYVKVIRKMLKEALNQGRVFSMVHRRLQKLPPNPFLEYEFHSQVVASEITPKGERPKDQVDPASMDFTSFHLRGPRTVDRMLDMMQEYYLEHLWDRYRSEVGDEERAAVLSVIRTLEPNAE